jgi:hypothetical protein
MMEEHIDVLKLPAYDLQRLLATLNTAIGSESALLGRRAERKALEGIRTSLMDQASSELRVKKAGDLEVTAHEAAHLRASPKSSAVGDATRRGSGSRAKVLRLVQRSSCART